MWSFEYGEQGNPDVFGDSNYDTVPDIGVGFDDPDVSDISICGDIGVAIESPTCPSEVYLFILLQFAGCFGQFSILVMLHVYFTSVQRKEEPPNGTQENMDTHESLDDLCRSHLVSLESTANGSVFHTSVPLDLFQILWTCVCTSW